MFSDSPDTLSREEFYKDMEKNSEIFIDVTDTITQLVVAQSIGGIQRVVLSVCGRLGQFAKFMFVDFERNRCYPVAPHELDFYSLVETLSPKIADAKTAFEVNAALIQHFSDRPPLEIPKGSQMWFLGGPWNSMPHASNFIRKKSEYCNVTCLVHDMLPIYKQNLFANGTDQFKQYFEELAPDRSINWVASADNVIADMQHYGLQGSIRKISFGCEFDIFRPAKTQNEDLYGLKDATYALMIGSIDGRKRHDLVVDAWIESGFYKQCKLFIAAYASDKKDRFFSCYEAARQTTEDVFFLQNIHDDEMARALRYCQFVIYPSEFEGWGLPISEAAYFGKYCLVKGQNFGHHRNVIPFSEDEILPLAADQFHVVRNRGNFLEERPSWHGFISALMTR